MFIYFLYNQVQNLFFSGSDSATKQVGTTQKKITLKFYNFTLVKFLNEGKVSFNKSYNVYDIYQITIFFQLWVHESAWYG